MPVKISVQICSFNRWSLLKRALEALFQQDLPKDQYEIVFVDDGSTDETLAMAQEMAKTAPCRMKVLTKKNDGLPRARNVGIRACEGDIILFMDDDTFADPALLREHIAFHDQYPKAVVQGWVNHIADLDYNGPRRYTMDDYSRSFFWTSNVSVRRKFVNEVGGFDEDFQEYGYQDMELGSRLRKLGLKKYVNNKAIVSHYKPPRQKKDLPRMMRQAESCGRSGMIYIRKRGGWHPRFSTGITQFRMGLDLLLRPLKPFFQSQFDSAPEGPMNAWTRFCARMLCSYRFFETVRKGDTNRPRPAADPGTSSEARPETGAGANP